MSTPAITTDTHVFFYSGRSIYSNWHRTTRQFHDPLNNHMVFDSSEQAFMWWKAVFFQDHKIAALIEADTNPGTCKSLARQITGYDDKSWECVRFGFMTYVLYLKFSQNPDFAAELKSTGNRILIEASPTDKVWGVGMDVESAAEHVQLGIALGANDVTWPGRNLLGEALMKVREML